jgi:hypothetical protein
MNKCSCKAGTDLEVKQREEIWRARLEMMGLQCDRGVRSQFPGSDGSISVFYFKIY